MTFRRDERGQVIVLFALALVVVIAAAGLLIDVGFGWSNRRDAQSAADTAALGAAVAAADGGSTSTAAVNVAGANGYPLSYTDCSGATVANGVVVNHPPLSGPHTVTNDPDGADSFVEVIVNRIQRNYFSSLVGQGCWPVSARAVAEIASSGAASCSFCSLNRSDDNHTLLLQNGATLRVDGDIYTNSINGGVGPDCPLDGKKGWQVCGDGFDIFGDPITPPAYISAKTISVSGGWETHDENVVMADTAEWPDYSTSPVTYQPCPSGSYPNPLAQTQTSNVCIHRPQIADPLNDPLQPLNVIPAPIAADYSAPTALSCPSGTQFPTGTLMTVTTNQTICPGMYTGGLDIVSGTATMLPGVYFMGGGGFHVSGTGSVDGTSGVMVYNSSGSGSLNILPNPDLAAPIVDGRSTPKLTISTDAKNNTVDVGKTVKFSVKVQTVKSGGKNVNGTLSIWDGNATGFCGTSSFNAKEGILSCSVTYAAKDVGTHGIVALFLSNDNCANATCYNNMAVALDPRLVVGKGTPIGTVAIATSGTVLLSGVKSGAYKGMVIYSDRTSNQGITISPGAGLGACGPNNTITVNGVTGPAWALQQPSPGPCGALGGIEGTVYAAHENAQVTITASGIADLQVIAGKILVTSQATARFSYDANKFAGGAIRLAE